MKAGILSDIHANEIALSAVLDDMPDVEVLVCAGDIIGYGPSPREVVEIVRDNFDLVIKGNHEKMLINGRVPNSNTARKGITHAQSQLFSEHYNWISSLPNSYNSDEVDVYHSHPDDSKMVHVYEEQIESEFGQYMRGNVFVYGHTHVPVNTRIRDTRVVNPGSVGQPRDGDKRASYAVLDIESQECEIRRVSYNTERVIQRLQENGFPEHSIKRIEDAS